MTVLSDLEIERQIAYGDLNVWPYEADQIQPCSIDIRLGHDISRYVVPEHQVLDTRHDDVEGCMEKDFVSEDEGVTVYPDDFILANTIEKISIPDYLGAAVRGRSSLGRMGIEVHSTAGWVDAGFGYPDGAELVLEISNNSSNPIVLHPIDRVAQLIFYQMNEPANIPYNEKEDNKYNDQTGAVGSKIWQDHHE